MRLIPIGLASLGLLALPTTGSAAEIIGGVEFPEGTISFADTIVTYAPGDPAPSTAYQGAFNALGIPDYVGANTCSSQVSCTFVSLGDGGSLVAAFTDNVLTGSGDSTLDLWIFEVGPDIEDMFVDISSDGSEWFSVGAVGGATSGVDIDSFGYGVGSSFSYVRLTDDTNRDGQSGATVGADIDAIGAISTRAVTGAVPEPATWAMMLVGFGAVGFGMRRRRKQDARARLKSA